MSIASERIEILHQKAKEKCRNGEEELCRRYTSLAKRIGEKTQTPIPRELKNRTCSKCGKFLLPGVNTRVRISDGKTVYTCECGKENKVVRENR